MPDSRVEEEQYAAIWVRVFTGPHRDHGGWWRVLPPITGGLHCGELAQGSAGKAMEWCSRR